MNKGKIIIALYYLLIGALVVTFSTIIPFQIAEKESVGYMNSRLSELKRERDVNHLDANSEAVINIINAGAKLDKEKFEELSGGFGLLAAIAVNLLTLFLSFTRLSDFVWIGVGFSVLYGLGSLNSESFIGILLLTFVAYLVKRKKSQK